MTDAQLVQHLRNSPDLDDQSIVERYDVLGWLKSKDSPSRTELKWIAILEEINARELEFLHAPTSYKIAHPRPCSPKWHWPVELRLLAVQCHETAERG